MSKKFNTLMINLMNENKSAKKDQTEINLHHYSKIVEIENQVEKHMKTYNKNHKDLFEMCSSLKADFAAVETKLRNFDSINHEKM